MVINFFYAFFFAFLATVAFGILFQAPKKTLIAGGIIGAVGWVVFVYLGKVAGYSSFYANFFATVVIALGSELCARIFKQPVTVYVIPGIIPLVPGLGMYRGMNMIIENSYEMGMNTLIIAAMDASAIALGMMFMASFFRVLKIRKERTMLLNAIRKNKCEGNK